ncbi:hypothetical protein [Spirosoma panaciterrae]|uniref:hypothetical protein n=1 Tax=Spirosoma panaciterrae TaxID=496058 RepID=UPI001FDF3F84|nr:hypothetical protein [Spirosoma panaciterrae]
MKARATLWLLITLLYACSLTGNAQPIGETLAPWKSGILDIHHINTGRGNATFFILPDGTTLLIDAGALDPTSERTLSPRNTRAVPSADRQPGEWIARYITKVMTMSQLPPRLDYAQLTHFHNDHMGSPSSLSPKADQGNFVLTGITQVAAFLPIDKLIDRGWPDYAYPYPQNNSMMTNYRAFVDWHSRQKGTVFERSKPGRADQIVLKKDPSAYTNTFEIRNIIANGELWTGSGTATRQLFPDRSALNTSQLPSENMCSIAIRLRYGAFDYFSGAICPAWSDLVRLPGTTLRRLFRR